MVYRTQDDQDEGDLQTGTRVCTECARRQPMTEFYRANGGKHRRRKCRSCVDAARRADKAADPDKYRSRDRRRALAVKYDLTPELFDALLAEQWYECALCPTRLTAQNAHVDHDHVNGWVRGLLCFNCNVAIGHFRDDPVLMRRAARYVQQSGPLALMKEDAA